MVRFLLDEHLPQKIAPAVYALRQEITVTSLYYWESGRFMGVDDAFVLAEAYEQGLTLVTYDLKTIPLLLVRWGERGIQHAGVVFGDEHTIETRDIVGVARALVQMWEEQGGLDWTNHIAYLNRAPFI